ncbi:MAG TPA: hypothetical protein VFG10_11685 [Saprospiraceae bacterium]|nr:hypothetical protein [Saprospiraceae bacterium]
MKPKFSAAILLPAIFTLMSVLLKLETLTLNAYDDINKLPQIKIYEVKLKTINYDSCKQKKETQPRIILIENPAFSISLIYSSTDFTSSPDSTLLSERNMFS